MERIKFSLLGGVIISFCAFFLMSQNVFADTPVTDGNIYVDYKLCGQYYSADADNIISDCSQVKVLEAHSGSQRYPGITYNSSDQKFYIEFDNILSNSDLNFCAGYNNGCHLIVSNIYFQPFDYNNTNSNNLLTAEGVINAEIYSPYQWFYGPMIDFSTSPVLMELQGYFIQPASYDVGYSYDQPYVDSWDYLCYDQTDTECWLGMQSSPVDFRYNAQFHLDMSVDGGSNSLFTSFILFARPWNSLTNQYVNSPSIIIDIPNVDSQMDFTFEMKVWLSDSMPSGSESGDLDINQETSDYYNNEYNAVSNIGGQNASDLNVGNGQTATNLIGYITTFVSYIGSINPSNDCNISLDFPSYAGGSTSVNLCQFKDNMGNIVSIISSLVLILFYIPLAYKMLSVIYSEIRSFTNG